MCAISSDHARCRSSGSTTNCALAGVGEHLLREVRGPARRLLDLTQVLHDRGFRRQAQPGQVGVAEHRHQDVVEVVGDAAGEHAEALELLGVQDLLLEAPPLVLGDFALGDILDCPEHPDRAPVGAEFKPAEPVNPPLGAVADATDRVFPVERPTGRQHLAGEVVSELFPLVRVDDPRPPVDVPDIVGVDAEDVVEHGRTRPRTRGGVELVVTDPRHVLRLAEPGLARAQRTLRARELEVLPHPVHQQVELEDVLLRVVGFLVRDTDDGHDGSRAEDRHGEEAPQPDVPLRVAPLELVGCRKVVDQDRAAWRTASPQMPVRSSS